MTPLPPWFLLKPLLRSTLLIWLSCHLFVAVLLLLSGGSFWPATRGAALLVLVVPLLLTIDLKIQRLRLLLANLAVPLPAVLGLAFLLAAILEISVGSAVASLLTGNAHP